MTKIVLDAESFKALASDTRLQILKALDARPLTVSELSRFLDLNKATVFEHLKQLMAAELTKREDDPARKWVYYKLTWKGRNILHPENVQIFVLLSLGALGVGGALFQTVAWIREFLGPVSSSEASAPAPQPQPVAGDQSEAQKSGPSSAASGPTQAGANAPASPEAPTDDGQAPWYESLWESDATLVLGLVLFALLLALLVWTLFGEQRRERAQLHEMLEKLPANVNDAEEPADPSAA
ncbi:MAG: ArsR family transcriptional regulator [Euryarchaeota archaeon]|nr:ArsR family transcriptional regulator [Euryarchaeota archaeon]